MKITTPIISLFACLAVAFSSVAQSNILNIEGGEATTVGIYIKNLATGKVIADHNSTLALTPASVTKSITTATALSMLGPDFQFATDVELVGERSGASRSTWNGNIVIHASADPTLESNDFKDYVGFTDSIISGLRRLGISEISGAVVIDERLKDAGPVTQWEVEDLAWGYGAGLYGFNYAGNTARVYPNKGTSVPVSDLNVIVKQANGDDTDQIRGWGSNDLYVWGTSANRANKSWCITTTLPNPAKSYASTLATGLRNAGIKIGTKAVSATSGSADVYTHYSPLATDIMRSLMKRSDNLFAEGMLRALDPYASRADCIKLEKSFWREHGVPTSTVMLYDGSGLTRANRLSPRFIGNVLEYMIKSDLADTYLDFFPISGVDGTLKSFLKNSPRVGRMALKTGSVSSVQTYAGYKLDGEGHPTHIVVVMVNGFFCPRAALRTKIEKYLLNIFPN
jgi:D-alanyl-D-alanine carboxypeptidase/D-alanyl-D-alanine-endopeptidase (penicillin-binding protein 4)